MLELVFIKDGEGGIGVGEDNVYLPVRVNDVEWLVHGALVLARLQFGDNGLLRALRECEKE